MKLPFYLLIYMAVINLAGFALCRSDKRRAQKSRRRFSEASLLFVGLCGGCLGLALGMALYRHKTRHLKFRILVPLECVIWAAVLIHGVSAVTLDRTIQYVELPYRSAAVAPGLNGYRAAFITDTHSIPAEELREVVGRVNTYAPDLLLLGGDFPSRGDAPARTMEILSWVETTDGIYGVEGNHDQYETLFAAMEQYGITPLSNAGVRVRQGLYVAGVEDLWNRSPDVAAATAGAGEGEFVLLLAHNPDITMQQDTTGADLILSGHTHGGQVTMFGLLAPALVWSRDISDYGRRFQSGWATSRDGTDVYVSNGTGYLTSVPRVFARPQVILITLYTDPDALEEDSKW